MSNIKKTAVAVLALSGGAVFAGTMGPVCSAVNVTVPCESTAWGFGGKALYFKPSLSGIATSRIVTHDPASGDSVDVGKNAKWGWGFMVEGAYNFSTGNDLNLNWYHLGNSTSGGFNGNAGPFYNLTLYSNNNGSAAAFINRVSTKLEPKWDMVNFELGQHVDFGDNKSIRFYGGFEYARLVSNVSASIVGSLVTVINVSGNQNTPSINNSYSDQASYNGFGPRLGTDMSYDWGNGFAIYAKGAAALLAGSAKVSEFFRDNLNVDSKRTYSSSVSVVPELEGKLGATYSYATSQGDLSLDVGWMWINYFDVVRSNGGGSATTGNSLSDFGLNGVYFGLSWLGNIA